VVVNDRLDGHDIKDATLQNNIDKVQSNLDAHNHDSTYLKQTGGNLTGATSINNNVPFAGKNTGGSSLNIGKVDANNRVSLGDTSAKAVLNASAGDLRVFNGTLEYKLFHEGNMGSGSGLDADSVDGLHASKFIRKDINNYFEADQFIENSKSIILRASSGSSSAGQLFFRDGSDNQKGKIYVASNGDMSMFAGTTNGHTFKATGEMFSTHNHVLDASSREVSVRFRNGSTDGGIGFYLNNSTNRLGMYDWENSKFLFTTDRSDGTVEFANSIKIKGHRLTLDWNAPANPVEGDVWININA
jgi:hypothetical protein